jgi:hypothetical protein
MYKYNNAACSLLHRTEHWPWHGLALPCAANRGREGASPEVLDGPATRLGEETEVALTGGWWWSRGGSARLGVAVAARRGSGPDEGVLRWLQLGGGRREVVCGGAPGEVVGCARLLRPYRRSILHGAHVVHAARRSSALVM